MATEVVMPKLGLTMETGTVGAWLVAEGGTVEKGRPLLEVVTDKVTMEVEAQASGILRQVLVPAGEEVPVATPVGIIAAADEDISALVASTSPRAPAGSSPLPSGAGRPAVDPAAASAPADVRPHRASPKARKMAREHCLDLSEVTGSGPGGRIVSADLQFLLASPAAAAAAPPARAAGPAAAGQLIALTRPQRVAAERLTASYQQTPHIQVAMRVSGVWLQQFREGYRLEGRKFSYNDLIIKATGRALVEFPRLNSVLEPGGVRQLPQVDIGVATDTPQGLLVPVVRQVPLKSIEEIAADVVRLVDAARHGGLSLDELSGGTFTISNLGMLGVSHFSAIINPPQVGILAVGALEKQVVALDNGGMAVQPQLNLTLGADHRVVDGALAARFLGRLKEILETPGLLA